MQKNNMIQETKCYKEQYGAGANMVEGSTRSRRQLDMKTREIKSRRQQ